MAAGLGCRASSAGLKRVEIELDRRIPKSGRIRFNPRAGRRPFRMGKPASTALRKRVIAVISKALAPLQGPVRGAGAVESHRFARAVDVKGEEQWRNGGVAAAFC